MAAISGAAAAGELAWGGGAWQQPGLLRRVGRLLRGYPLGVFGLLMLIGFIVLGLFGPALAPYDPRGLRAGSPLGGLSPAHPFGLNNLGEDLFSRVLAGARTTLTISGTAVLIGGSLGSFIGILSGFYGRWLDYLLQRSGEAFAAFPGLILYLMLITAFGRGPKTIVLALAVGGLFGGSRVLRAATIVERHSTYVDAARALGCSERRVFFRHVVPNVLPLTVVLISSGLGAAILAESGLAFLGLGVAPGTPSWGIDLSGANLTFARLGHWNLVVFPGLAISLAVLGANLLGDALRDIWDPRLRGRR
ncbi:MAG TPA: ABC transporter permease [Dehalococcoidia bacterium]|nr:ABC transporter permease [Dehalococcoidia bacterium]